MVDDRSDAALVDAARAGDLAAYEELVRRHQAFVLATAKRVVRDRAAAEDITQEAFFRAWRKLGDFRGDAQFRSWMYRIATNLALNQVTRSREQPAAELPETRPVTGAESTAVDRAMQERWDAEVERLPDDLRAPYVLRERDDRTYEEIAAELGIPLNTVRTRIFRARKRIAEGMKEWQ